MPEGCGEGNETPPEQEGDLDKVGSGGRGRTGGAGGGVGMEGCNGGFGECSREVNVGEGDGCRVSPFV